LTAALAPRHRFTADGGLASSPPAADDVTDPDDGDVIGDALLPPEMPCCARNVSNGGR